MSNKKNCQTCKKNPIRYKLYLDEDVKCPHCKHIKYTKKSEKLFLCSTTCPGLYWWPVEYLTPKNTKDTKVIYCLEKDECNKCGKRDFPEALFVGEYLDATVPVVNYMLGGQIPVDPSTFVINDKTDMDDPIIINNKRIKIYLPKNNKIDGQCKHFYSSYHMVLKSNKGFTITRLCHAAYQLLINSIDDVFDGKNNWKNNCIEGICFDENTLSAYVKLVDN